MTTNPKSRWWACILALVLMMACVIPPVGTQSMPTIDPGAVNTFIAQTAHAAATRTMASIPSVTLTPTISPTPTETPTSTPTFIFILASFTPVATETFTGTPTPVVLGGSGTSSDNFACQVLRVSPPNGSAFDARAEFDVTWTVKNIGKRIWDGGEIDYMYESGAKLHEISGFDLPQNVRPGNSTELRAHMRAPKAAGTYNTTWILTTGNRTFCPLPYTIVVR